MTRRTQDPPGLDLTKFTRVVGLLGSDHDGERANAVTTGSRMLEAVGMRWEDFVDAYRRDEIATEAAALLLAENTELRGEIDRLRSTSTAIALWQDVEAPNAAPPRCRRVGARPPPPRAGMAVRV